MVAPHSADDWMHTSAIRRTFGFLTWKVPDELEETTERIAAAHARPRADQSAACANHTLAGTHSLCLVWGGEMQTCGSAPIVVPGLKGGAAGAGWMNYRESLKSRISGIDCETDRTKYCATPVPPLCHPCVSLTLVNRAAHHTAAPIRAHRPNRAQADAVRVNHGLARTYMI